MATFGEAKQPYTAETIGINLPIVVAVNLCDQSNESQKAKYKTQVPETKANEEMVQRLASAQRPQWKKIRVKRK